LSADTFAVSDAWNSAIAAIRFDGRPSSMQDVAL
jgi:hypothetical protein